MSHDGGRARDFSEHLQSVQLFTWPQNGPKTGLVQWPLNWERPTGKFVLSKDASCDPSQANVLANQLDNTLLVSFILLSPLYSIAKMPAIVANPPLRMIGLLACVVDLTAVISAAAFRLRLKTLSWKGEDEQFAKNATSNHSTRYLAISSPILLISAALILFLATMSGSFILSDTS